MDVELAIQQKRNHVLLSIWTPDFKQLMDFTRFPDSDAAEETGRRHCRENGWDITRIVRPGITGMKLRQST